MHMQYWMCSQLVLCSGNNIKSVLNNNYDTLKGDCILKMCIDNMHAVTCHMHVRHMYA